MKLMPYEFWVTFAAVMSANLLTVFFVYAMYSKSRQERGEKIELTDIGLYGGMLIPLLLTLGAGYMISR